MKAYKKLMNGLAKIEGFIQSAILVFVTLITFANVCVRYLSDGQFAWSEELTVNLFVLLTMMGCALCIREGSLITLSLVFDLIKLKGKKVLVAISTAMNIVFWSILVKTGFEKVMTQMANGKRTPSLLLPEWIFTIFLPIGAILLILHNIEYFMDFMSKKEEEIEA